MGCESIMSEKYIDEISPIGGIYSDFIYMKDKSLVSIIKVQGFNVDMLSSYDQNTLFDDYGTFLAQSVHYLPQTVSKTVPIKLEHYIKNWKKVFMISEKDDNANEELRQLRASYLVEYQKVEMNVKMAKKEHFLVLSEEIKKPTIEFLKAAEENLRTKTEEVKQSLSEFLDGYSSNIEILSSYEAKKLLHQYLDYEMSIFDR